MECFALLKGGHHKDCMKVEITQLIMNSPTQSTVTITMTSLSSWTEYRAIHSSSRALEERAKCPVLSVLLQNFGGDRAPLEVSRGRTKGSNNNNKNTNKPKTTTFHDIRSITAQSRGCDHWELQVTPLSAQFLTKTLPSGRCSPQLRATKKNHCLLSTQQDFASLQQKHHHQQLIKTSKAAQTCLTLLCF